MTRNCIAGIWYSADDPLHMMAIRKAWTSAKGGGNGSLLKEYMSDEEVAQKEAERKERIKNYGKAYRKKLEELEAKI
jgi:hypothetical protein